MNTTFIDSVGACRDCAEDCRGGARLIYVGSEIFAPLSEHQKALVREGMAIGVPNVFTELDVAGIVEAAVLAEREACAETAEDTAPGRDADAIADAIRGRVLYVRKPTDGARDYGDRHACE